MKIVDLKLFRIVFDGPKRATLVWVYGPIGLGYCWMDEPQWMAGRHGPGWCVCIGRLSVAIVKP